MDQSVKYGESEQCTLNFEKRCLIIVDTFRIDKAKRGKKVPVPPMLMTYINRHRISRQTHLIWNNRRPIKNVRKSIENLLERAGITEHLYPHDLRRSYDRFARRAGIDDVVRRAVMGHSQSLDAHARYEAVPYEDLIEAGVKIQKGLSERLLRMPDVL